MEMTERLVLIILGVACEPHYKKNKIMDILHCVWARLSQPSCAAVANDIK